MTQQRWRDSGRSTRGYGCNSSRWPDSKDQVAAFDPTAVAPFKADQLGAMDKTAMAGFKSDQVAALDPTAMAGFKADQLGAMDPTAMAGFKSDQVAAMDPTAMAGFKAIKNRPRWIQQPWPASNQTKWPHRSNSDGWV